MGVDFPGYGLLPARNEDAPREYAGAVRQNKMIAGSENRFCRKGPTASGQSWSTQIEQNNRELHGHTFIRTVLLKMMRLLFGM